VKKSKRSLTGRRQVTTEEATRVAKENGMAYIETSAKTSANVEEVSLFYSLDVHQYGGVNK